MWGSARQNNPDTESATVPTPTTSNAPTTSMSWETRVQCFLGFFILSLVSSLCANYLLLLLRLTGFCIMTSIGAVLSMTGSTFLMGPVSQLKSMFHKSRWLSSSLYLFFIVMSIVSGLWLKNAPLAIICLVGEYTALAFYCLSYIPYSREFLSRMFCSCW